MANFYSSNTPPERTTIFDVPLSHKTYEFYKKIYSLSSKISKRDRFGIYLKIENLLLEIIDLVITAALQNRNSKLPTLNSARIKIEIMKRMIRLTGELGIVDNGKYLELEKDLQEISKDTNNWIRNLLPRSSKKEIPQ